MHLADLLAVDQRAELARWFPERGPCAFCGHPDARHRLWDAIQYNPEPDADVAQWYELPVGAVEAVRRLRPYACPTLERQP